MVGSSKILTVSYGTFSCTLEGFDDSFGTMKAIAEYFRDLAADDRYFGAEPPVPDAEMLARIAEREVARRVEARLDGKGVTLRTGEALPRAVVHASDELGQTEALSVRDAPAEDVSPRSRPIMRQVISQAAPDQAEHSAAPVMPPLAVAPTPTVLGPLSAVVPPPRVEPDQDARIIPPAAEWPVATPAPLTPPAFSILAHPDADSVAAKLQRIRAVVGQNAVASTPLEFAEDLGEMTVPAQTTTRIQPASRGQSLSEQWNDLIEAPDTAQADEPDMTALDDAVDMDALSAALAAQAPEAMVQTMAQSESEPEPLAPAQDFAVAPTRPRVIKVRRADFEASVMAGPAYETAAELDAVDHALDDDFSERDADVDPDGIADLLALDGSKDSDLTDTDDGISFDRVPEDASATGFSDGTLPPDAEAALLEELAALERDTVAEVSPDLAVFEADDAGQDTDATFSMANVMAATSVDPTEPMADDAMPVDAGHWDQTTKDEGVIDFSAITDAETDLSIADANTAFDAMAPSENPPLRPGRDLLEREPEADEEAMERILSQTDAELNSPENSRRREAISQLKAAVAATEAARQLGEKTEVSNEADVETAFRDDLKQVVRPRRPVGDVSPDLRSERPRPAPLKLVASQRIDIPAPRPAPQSIIPVRPRRVAVVDDPVAAPLTGQTPIAGSFAEFAANMGASELPDLLEAAAAYTSFVEGVEDFSRPQLMKKVQDMAAQDYSREDGLRSFGTLLRQGRIMKTANGRFVVNEESRFNPERKSA